MGMRVRAGYGKPGRLGWGRFRGLPLACACFFQCFLRAWCASCARAGARECLFKLQKYAIKSSMQQRDPRVLRHQSLRASPGRLDAPACLAEISLLPPVLQAPPEAAGPQHAHEESLQHVQTNGAPHHHSELSVGYTLPATHHPEGIPCNLNRSAKVMRRPRAGR